MRALILGAAGMLGHKLWLTLRERGQTFATVRRAASDYASLDLFEPRRLIDCCDAAADADLDRAFRRARPDIVYNCVGIVKQRNEARSAIQSITVNALLPHRLAARCAASGARLVQISTDCVFSGRRGMYTEDDPPDAIDLYGRSKLLGEVESGALTIRTSMVGRELATAHGLVEWFMAQRGGAVRGFTRAVFSGFSTLELARVLADVPERFSALGGLWHVSADPISKCDLLALLNDAFRLGTRIEPDSSFECDRSLDSSRFRRLTGYAPPSWPSMVDEMARDATPYDTWMGAWTSMAST